jgi:hypothetical protein
MTEMTTKSNAPRICPECGVEFTPPPARGQQRVFCCDEHKQAHATRKTVRGKSLVSIALAMRKAYSGSRKDPVDAEFAKFLYADMMAMLDNWNAEDKAAGRMDPVSYAKTLTNFTRVNPDYNGGRSFEADRWFDRQERR